MTTNATVDDAFQSYSTSAFYVRCLKDKEASKKEPEAKLDPIKHDDYKYFPDERDGTEYPFVNIGKKNWMAKNLNYKTKAGNSACYNNLDENCDNYGRLYNWAAATSTADSVCPRGWNLPTDADWTDLTSTVGSGAAGKLKAKIGWEIKSTNGTTGTKGTDDYGFAALPGGYGNLSTGNFVTGNTIVNFGSARGGFWWSATQYAANGAYIRHIGPTSTNVTRIDNDRSRMYSVRCVSEGDFCGGEQYFKDKGEFCQEENAIKNKCDGREYSSSEFCQDDEVVPICEGKKYGRDQVCQNNKLVRRDCSDFKDEDKTRNHYGQTKEQFCDPRDGNKYVYVEKNGYLWMAENLNYKAPNTKDVNGNTTDINSKCYGDATGYDSQKNCEKYGRLYTPEAAKTSCPEGWRLPSGADWDALLGKGNAYELKVVDGKENGWSNNGGGVDLPAGLFILKKSKIHYLISDQANSQSYELSNYGYWWSADTYENGSFYRKMGFNDHIVTNNKIDNSNNSRNLYSVRCVNEKPRCNGIEWNPETDGVCKPPEVIIEGEPCGGGSYDKLTEFCYENKVGKLCGHRMETYDPYLYECGTANPNAIYLKEKIVDKRDENEYKAVLIGKQTWMAENLKFNAEGSMCRADIKDYCEIYGRLYNWTIAMAGSSVDNNNPSKVQGICPEGWHLPSWPEWQELSTKIGGLDQMIKLISASSWKSEDEYGFAALLGGGALNNGSEDSNAPFGRSDGWWATTTSNYLALIYNNTGGDNFGLQHISSRTGFRHVRCLKNN
jgi:uncharacterized protein (TIGR02145 family)